MATSRKAVDDISINLNCYTIRFRKKGDKETFYSYKEVFNDVPFKDFIQSFINTIDEKCFKNGNADRILSLKEILSMSASIVSGIIKKGHSSHETYIEKIEGGKPILVNTVTPDQFNSSPFYFLISLPSSTSKKMVFVAQSYKQYGFKEVLEEAFKNFIKQTYGDEIVAEFGTLSIASLFKKYIHEGKIRKLRLRKHGLTPEIEQIVQDENYEAKDYEVEMSVKVKRRNAKFLNYIKDVDLEDASFLELFRIEGYNYDEALVDISAGGRKRVLNFSDPDSFAASYDVTKQADINKNTKHPDFEKLNNEALAILKNEIIPNLK